LTAQLTDSFSQLRILWFINPDYRAGLRHGGSLRFFNLAKELVRAGHEVYFVMRKVEESEAARKREFLATLKEQGMMTGFFEIEFSYPRLRGKIGSVSTYPGAANRLLKKYQNQAAARLSEIAHEKQINLAIFNDRDQLFLLPRLSREIKVIVDWVDSATLFFEREIRVGWKDKRLAALPKLLRCLVDALAQERYYSKRADMNLLVSPVDKRCLDALNRAAEKNRVLLNGLSIKEGRGGATKIPHRIIFSGNMDFEPNYTAALWFIDNVLPLLLKRRSDLKLIIAGANPVPELVARGDEHVEVTGFVEDMGQEIAKSALYVAPLVSGGGFKNKIIEAIANDTFIVASGMAVEFLEPKLQQYLLIAETPEEMAERILSYLNNPDEFEAQLKTLKNIISTEFTWAKRMEELVQIAQQIFSRSHSSSQDEALLSSIGRTSRSGVGG